MTPLILLRTLLTRTFAQNNQRGHRIFSQRDHRPGILRLHSRPGIRYGELADG